MATIPNLLGVHALVWVGGWSKEQCREAIKNTASVFLSSPLNFRSDFIPHQNTNKVIKTYEIPTKIPPVANCCIKTL
jgi:hypothetical protein